MVCRRINLIWGSFENFVTSFNKKTVAVRGSGWGWLGYDCLTTRLAIVTTSNQELFESKFELVPLLTIDVWEHAYYVDYLNDRGGFLKGIWKVVNWQEVAARYEAARKLPSK